MSYNTHLLNVIGLLDELNLRIVCLQKWLDYYGPYEAVVDGANVGLFTQRKFRPSKVSPFGLPG